MNARFLKMLHDRSDKHLLPIGSSVHVNLRGVAEVFVHQKRLIRCEVSLTQVAVQLLLVGKNLHSSSTQHVGRANQDGEANFLNGRTKVVC